MSEFDDVYDEVLNSFLDNANKQNNQKTYPKGEITTRHYNENNMPVFKQYHHIGCFNPCSFCPENDLRIFENSEKPPLPAHPHCDCYYTTIKTKKAGTISQKGTEGPDYWLKYFGKLPDYYITKDEAWYIYGWKSGENLSRLAPEKFIGGDVYFNRLRLLPEKEGRIWYECDVDYSGNRRRDSGRIYYSNDGLMFYSPDHGTTTFYLIQ